MTANSACNQVLQIIKESNLNFLINETPYSAFVTIRKKFVKCSAEVTLETEVIHEKPARENISNNELDNKFEALVVENNNLKEKLIQLESDNKNINIRLEIAKGQLSNKTDAFEEAVKDKKAISEKNETFVSELKQAKKRLTNLEKGDKEKDDNLVMLEMTLKNRDLERKHLKIELESMRTCFKCEECEFTSNLESDLNSHIESMHQHFCSHCSCSYVGEKKLKKHLCRIFLCNPSCPEKGFYTKDWFERNKCIRVFDTNTETEVAVLHSEDCVEKNICVTFLDDFEKTGSFKDDEGITNLSDKNYITDKTVNWTSVNIIVKIMNLKPNLNLFPGLTLKS